MVDGTTVPSFPSEEMGDFAHLGPLEKYVYQLERLTGSPADAAFLAVLLLCSVVLSVVFRFLRSETIRLLASLVFGLGLSFALFGPLVVAFFVFYSLFERFLMLQEVNPFIITYLGLGSLAVVHIQRQVMDYMGYKFDMSLIFMLVVVKMSMISFDIDDGRKIQRQEKLHPKEHIEKSRRKLAVIKFPNCLEFLSYTFFYVGGLSGPVCNYSVFRDFIAGKNEFSVQASPWKAALVTFRHSIVCLALYQFGNRFFNLEVIFADSFHEWNFAARFAYIILAIDFIRYRYSFVWYLSEVSSVVSGFGVRTENGVTRYDAGRNCFAYRVETAENIGELMANWNVATSHWLKCYIYERIGSSNKTWATLVTRGTAAVWHGFYPGYYMMFIGSVLLDMVQVRSRAKIWPKVENSPTRRQIYTVLGTLCTLVSTLYMGSSALVLSAERSIHIYKSTYYVLHIVPIVAIVFLSLIPSKKKDA